MSNQYPPPSAIPERPPSDPRLASPGAAGGLPPFVPATGAPASGAAAAPSYQPALADPPITKPSVPPVPGYPDLGGQQAAVQRGPVQPTGVAAAVLGTPGGVEPSPGAAAIPPRPPSALSARPQNRPAAVTRIGMTQMMQEGDLDLEAALRTMIEAGGSDLHITTGAPPMIRFDGGLAPLEGFPTLNPDRIQRAIYAILTQRQREQFEEHLELDFAHAVRGVARFRVNLYQQRDSLGAAFRVIPYEIKPLEELGIPPVVGNFAGLPRGLVLVTGPTGSGKSTTLAAVIDLANRTRNDHIMTVEDPIEFLHRHKKSLVNQREVGADTLSFANALKHVLRQDPDIILVGELRDLETISVALTAAETGHLVFGTLHTQDAAQTIDRIIDVFPAHQQDQVRTQLASSLQGVVCQTLCKRASGRGRIAATEVLVATPAVRNLIREGKTHQIYSAMQAGAALGMHTLDQHLAELVRAGRITYEVGLEKCHHVEDYNRLTGRSARMTQGSVALNTMGGQGGDYVSGAH